MSDAPRSRGFPLGTLLKTLFAVALLVWVAQGLDWSDRLEYVPDPESSSSVIGIDGTIEGDWRGETVLFRLAQEETLSGPWPVGALDAFATDEALHVARRAEQQAGYQWRPGMPRIFLAVRGMGLVYAIAFLFAGLFFGVTRWWRILNLAGCPSTWRNTLRLAFLGLFFNLALPGLTGGDLPKAVLAVREHPERRADALATVVIDRLVGLWVLVLLGTGTVWWMGGNFEPLRLPSLAILVALTGGLVGILAPGLRQLLGIDRWIERLPQGQRLKKLEKAALLYRGHAGELLTSVLLSLGNHLCVVAAIYSIGRALGDLLDFGTYLGVVPVANLITALPISPAGWGVGEKAYGTLFEMMGATAAIGVAVSLTFRLCTVFLGLAGGLLLLLPGGEQARQAARESQDSSAPGN